MFQRQALNYALAGTQSVRYSSGKLKELGIRIKSVTNIQKITKTMNMISAAKYAKASKELDSARSFGAAGAGAANAVTMSEDAGGKRVLILASSDRGLCGALNSDFQWSNGTIFYNFHKSAMTQEIETMNVASEGGLASAGDIEAFDSVDADVLKNYAEFSLACTLYGAVKENFISEQAARMISM